MCCLGDFLSYVIVDNKHFKKISCLPFPLQTIATLWTRVASTRMTTTPTMHQTGQQPGSELEMVKLRSERLPSVTMTTYRWETWIHGFTAAQWVRSDPEPAALQRRLFSEQCESCQRCILNERRETDGGGTISAELLWQFTGKKVRCLISFRRTCRLVSESSKQYCGRSDS